MATYKDDLDIIKAAEKDSSKLSLNAITELDNKGLLGMYGGGGSEEDLYPDFDGYFTIDESVDAIYSYDRVFYKLIVGKEPKDASVDGVFYRNTRNNIAFCTRSDFASDYKEFAVPSIPDLGFSGGNIIWYSEAELEDEGGSGIIQPNTWYYATFSK